MQSSSVKTRWVPRGRGATTGLLHNAHGQPGHAAIERCLALLRRFAVVDDDDLIRVVRIILFGERTKALCQLARPPSCWYDYRENNALRIDSSHAST
jgi:hypothetical protein